MTEERWLACQQSKQDGKIGGFWKVITGTAAVLLKCNLLRFVGAVFVSQMAVSFHAQRAAVLVSKPARNGRNVHSVFDAAGGKQMALVVVREPLLLR